MTIKRYSPPPSLGQFDVQTPGRMHRDDTGAYVKYSDHKKALAEAAPTQFVSLPEGPQIEKAVEAMARHQCAAGCCNPDGDEWEDMGDFIRGEMLREAREELEAALPYLQQPQPIGVEEGLREQVDEAESSAMHWHGVVVEAAEEFEQWADQADQNRQPDASRKYRQCSQYLADRLEAALAPPQQQEGK